MVPRLLLLASSLLMWANHAGADRPVYKSVDASGTVTYSDRKSGVGDTHVKNWMPASLGRNAYDAAVLRAESARYYYARLLAERRQTVPVVVYDPRGWQADRSRPVLAAASGASWRARWDPNLPVSPAPSLERNYYYNGR